MYLDSVSLDEALEFRESDWPEFIRIANSRLQKKKRGWRDPEDFFRYYSSVALYEVDVEQVPGEGQTLKVRDLHVDRETFEEIFEPFASLLDGQSLRVFAQESDELRFFKITFQSGDVVFREAEVKWPG